MVLYFEEREFQRDTPAKDNFYASFKYGKPWPWLVEVIPGVGVVGLVTNKELCQVLWGIIIKNFMHKHSFIVSELLR